MNTKLGKILAEISAGELIDKITILIRIILIKKRQIIMMLCPRIIFMKNLMEI